MSVRWRKVAGCGALAVAGVLAIAVLVLTFMDWNLLKRPLEHIASGHLNSDGLYTVAYLPSDVFWPHILALLFTKCGARAALAGQVLPLSVLMLVNAFFHKPTTRPSGR